MRHTQIYEGERGAERVVRAECLNGVNGVTFWLWYEGRAGRGAAGPETAASGWADASFFGGEQGEEREIKCCTCAAESA